MTNLPNFDLLILFELNSFGNYESGLIEMKDKILRFRHTMYNLVGKIICAETELTGLHIDTEKRKGEQFPSFIIEQIQRYKTSSAL